MEKSVNLTGQRFGRWTVIRQAEDKNGKIYWHCKCDCGNEKDVYVSSLVRGKSKSCGCLSKEIQSQQKLKNLTGERFGKLTVIERAENKITLKGQSKTVWKCHCDCGNEVNVLASSLGRGNTKSCGCYSVEYANKNKYIDLSGQKFGKLTVLRRTRMKDRNSYWLCRCECGAEKEVSMVALRHGQKSCGCSMYDWVEDRIIGNEYTVDENNVVHVILRAGEEMLCDMEDWEKLKQFTWRKDKWGYVVTSTSRKIKKFHIEVMGKKNGYVVDHEDRNKLNNQKSNLRFLTKSGNAVNSKLSKNNTSGIKGVQSTRNGKWVASLTLNRRRIHLGTYETIEEAAEARRKGEEKYFKPLFENKEN